MSPPTDSENNSRFLRRLRKDQPDEPPTGGLPVNEIKQRIASRLLTELPTDITEAELHRQSRDIIRAVVAEPAFALPAEEQSRLVTQLLHEALKAGPLSALLADEHVREIIIASPAEIYVKREDQLDRVQAAFENHDHMLRILDRLVRLHTGQALTLDELSSALYIPCGSLGLTILRPPSTSALIAIIVRLR